MWRAQPSYWSKLFAMSVVFCQSLLLLQKSSLHARFGNSLCFGCVVLWSLVLLTFSKSLWSVGTISLISSTRFFLLLVGWLFFNFNFFIYGLLGIFPSMRSYHLSTKKIICFLPKSKYFVIRLSNVCQVLPYYIRHEKLWVSFAWFWTFSPLGQTASVWLFGIKYVGKKCPPIMGLPDFGIIGHCFFN